MAYEKSSRAELIKTIERQTELIQRREQRLRDVITAYKGVVKEKEALESTVKVLSQSKSRTHLEVPHFKGPSSVDSASDRGRESDRESEDGSVKEFSDPLNISGAGNERALESDAATELQEVQSQVETLSNSLLTITEEKSKLEANYIAEKKVLKQEAEELQIKKSELQRKVETLEKDLEQKTAEWKNRIRNQQIEREKEQTDHVVMLRELQKLLANERQAKEHIENQYDEAQFSLKESQHLISDLTSQHEAELVRLKDQIEALKDQVRLTELKAQEPSPLLVDLQRETARLKEEHALLVQQDESHAEDAEQRARLYRQQCEARIAVLEAKLAELSETVGNYERLRFNDQQAIQRLKERVAQLDLENTALVEAAKDQGASVEDSSLYDIPSLVEKIVRLKAQLRQANAQTDKPVNIEELLMADIDAEHPLCKKYREELDQLRDEFERYRLRAQSVLKNKKEGSQSREEEVLKEHVSELREKLRNQLAQHEEELEQCRAREDNMRKTLLMVQDKHKQEILQMQTEHHAQLQEFEEEIKKQRDRTVSMLAEKERELESLRATSTQHLQNDYLMRYRSGHDVAGASSEKQNLEEEAVTRLLANPPSGQGEMTLLYFAQEQARKDVDINNLRKQKREIEMSLRELQASSSSKQEQLFEEIDKLKEEIRRLDRSISREGANLEYLKNVTYKFLICTDTAGKQQMLNAITTILQFSSQEKATVQAYNKGWWGSGSGAHKSNKSGKS